MPHSLVGFFSIPISAEWLRMSQWINGHLLKCVFSQQHIHFSLFFAEIDCLVIRKIFKLAVKNKTKHLITWKSTEYLF